MTTPPPNPSHAGLKWAFRICITLFLLPFFGVGLVLVTGGGIAGSQGGLFTGLGVFGVLIGLAFLGVPTLMLILVWTSSFKGPGAGSRGELKVQTTNEASNVAMQTCSYCQRPRPVAEATCPACGARGTTRAEEH